VVGRGCSICGLDPCPVAVPEPPPPFSVVMLNGHRWFNIPSSMNWNWYNIDRDGLWCWEDLWHAGTPELVPFDWSRSYWGCQGEDLCDPCTRVWTVEEMARLQPGNPSSAPQCEGCGLPHMWPHPKEIDRG
jgi:hypothetical protein